MILIEVAPQITRIFTDFHRFRTIHSLFDFNIKVFESVKIRENP